jgi:hypothetical protein
MAPQQIRWGTAILHLDQQEFQEGYEQGRMYFFDEFGESDPEPSLLDPQDWLQVSDIASTVLCGDCNGGQRLCFDTGDLSHPLRLLGIIVGYMSGPLHPETMAEQAERLNDAVVWHETTSDGLPSLSLRQ